MTTRVPPIIPGTRAELAAIEASIKTQHGDISLLYEVLLNSAPLADDWERMLTVGLALPRSAADRTLAMSRR